MSRALPCLDLSKGASFSPVLRAFVSISLDIRFLVILSGALRVWFTITHDIEGYHSLGLILWVRSFFPSPRRKISCHVEAKNLDANRICFACLPDFFPSLVCWPYRSGSSAAQLERYDPGVLHGIDSCHHNNTEKP